MEGMMRKLMQLVPGAKRVGGKVAMAVTAGVLTLALASPVVAADLVNKDRKAHTVLVTNADTPGYFVVKSGQKKRNVCDSCTVTVQGVGTIELSTNEMAVIRNGRLTKRSVRAGR